MLSRRLYIFTNTQEQETWIEKQDHQKKKPLQVKD